MTTQMATPAGWYPDPDRRHQYRYWDGAKWSPMVSDSGATATDPLQSPPPTPQLQLPPPTPPGAGPSAYVQQAASGRPMAGVDPRIAGTVAEYATRQYKVVAVAGSSVTLERPKTRLNWLLTVMLIIVTGGVVALLYVLGWAIWGVHRTYRVTIALGPQGEVEEIGDDRQIFDRDRLQAHRRRCVGYQITLVLVTIFGLIGVVGSIASGDATDPLATALAGGGILVLLPAALAVLPFSLARKAARQLGMATDWWRFGM